MSIVANLGSKRRNEDSECDKYLVENLRVEEPSEEFKVFDNPSFKWVGGAYGRVAFDSRGHAIKFTKATPLKGAEEPYNTCIAHKKGHAPELYDAWKVKDVNDDVFLAMDMEKYDMDLFDYVRKFGNNADDADVDVSLLEAINHMSKDRTCHEDLHPGNIILKRGSDGHYNVKIIDWSFAKFGEKKCKNPLSFYEFMDDVIEEEFGRRFPRNYAAYMNMRAKEKAEAVIEKN